ncbi:unnamed protein product [Paramecium sonneborni]|uniref:Uncharacterized protein n=1 Tax=Paramecium sonneborni TaxID=65129 RepID=A0A8S1P5M4_9CILI|nr:unnamed protein product [Paramecium sonneborni]
MIAPSISTIMFFFYTMILENDLPFQNSQNILYFINQLKSFIIYQLFEECSFQKNYYYSHFILFLLLVNDYFSFLKKMLSGISMIDSFVLEIPLYQLLVGELKIMLILVQTCRICQNNIKAAKLMSTINFGYLLFYFQDQLWDLNLKLSIQLHLELFKMNSLNCGCLMYLQEYSFQFLFHRQELLKKNKFQIPQLVKIQKKIDYIKTLNLFSFINQSWIRL